MRFSLAVWAWLGCAGAAVFGASGTLRVLPSNPQYFEYRGKPTVLITSGEHYGAVLNMDFDGMKYLEALSRDGLNLTRVFSGAYVEPSGAFGITRNTLAPGPGRYAAPWARSETPGYAGGGMKFDLKRWDEAYFGRLRDFVARAERRGVVVEMNLFCPFYEESQWLLSPMNVSNNVNGVGGVARTNVYTLDRNGGLLEVHEALVRRVVFELNAYPNVFYEICNEPYFGGVTLDWQHHIAQVIANAEDGLGRRHLVSRNVANGSEKVERLHPSVSFLNFHYAHPPDAVALNRHLNCPVGDNETGFRGTNDIPYRVEAWSFLLAGGALFNHLDYSFVAGHEHGTFAYPATSPGGGNVGFRRQLKVLVDFMGELDFARMKPIAGLEVAGEGMRAYGLGQSGRSYAVYVGPDLRDEPWKLGKVLEPGAGSLAVSFEAPSGSYKAEWLDPVGGAVRSQLRLVHAGGRLRLEVPSPRVDAVVRVRK